MKKFVTIFLFAAVLAFAFDASAQTGQNWKWQHQTPQGNTLRWVKMWDANNWYAVGYAGTFMKTSNAGTSWTFAHNAGGQYLYYTGQAIFQYTAHFFNQNTGLVGGSASVNGGIARTTNGGVTWDTAYSNLFTSGIVYFFYFVDANTGFMAGSMTPKIWKTTNAGINWTGITTAPTTTIYDIHAWDANTIGIVTTSGNFQKSTDGGATWSATISTGNTSVNYRMLFADANTGYVSGTSGKFAYTVNGGANWTLATVTNTSTKYDIDVRSSAGSVTTKLNEGFENATFPPTGWSSFSVLGANTWVRTTGNFHSGTASAFIGYESTGGEDWLVSSKVNQVGSGDSLVFWWKNSFSSAYEPDSLIIRVSTTDSLQASFTNVVTRINSATAPFTWTRFAFSLGAYSGQNIFVAFQHKNTDGNGGYLDDVMISGMSAGVNKVFLTGDAFYIYKTTNNGTNWDTVGFLADASIQPWTSTYYSSDFSATGDTLVTVGASGLINRRLSAGNNQLFTAFKKAGTHYDVWANNTGLVLVVGSRSAPTSAPDQVYRSTNGGSTYSIATFPATAYGYLNSIHMIDNNTGWAVGSNTSVFKTTNGGSSWDSVPTPFTEASKVLSKVQFVNANTGWIFSKTSMTGDSTIIKTTNGGTTWFKQTLGNALTGSSAQIYWADMVDANTGYCVNYTPRPYKTTDGGATWTLNTIADAFGGFMYGIDMIDANTGYIAGSSGRMYKTVNGGTLWDTLTNRPGWSNPSWYAAKFKNANVGVFCGTNGMTAITTNGGTSFSLENTSSSTLYNLFLTPLAGYTVGSGSSIHRNDALPTGTGNNLAEVPTQFELSQNYPNPFNPVTTIRFALPKAAIVTMKVYDMLGREVIRAINNVGYNAGWNSFTFDGSKLASGVYFYSIVIDNKVMDTKRMVLVK